MDNDSLAPALANILAEPSLEAFLALTPYEFELLVMHIFRMAGFFVDNVSKEYFPHGPGVDAELHQLLDEKHLIAYLEIKHSRQTDANGNVSVDVVDRLYGICHAPNVGPGIGYVVTNRFFREPAVKRAEAYLGDIKLINGEHLVRFLRYLQRIQIGSLPRTSIFPVDPGIFARADTINKRSPQETRIVSIVNNKGGVAKTTSALNIGFYYASVGQSVLFIDLDGQRNLTQAVLTEQSLPTMEESIASYYVQNTPLSHLITKSIYPNISLIASHPALMNIFQDGVTAPERELAFVEAIHLDTLQSSKQTSFDWIIIDTPPSQGLYTRMACAASHYVLLPIVAEFFAIEGAKAALKTIAAMSMLAGNTPIFHQAVITKWGNSTTEDGYLPKIRSLGVELILDALKAKELAIPNDPSIGKSYTTIGKRQPKTIFNLSRTQGKAAEAYEHLAKEIQHHVHDHYATQG